MRRVTLPPLAALSPHLLVLLSLLLSHLRILLLRRCSCLHHYPSG